jgi:hypothetical protein
MRALVHFRTNTSPCVGETASQHSRTTAAATHSTHFMHSTKGLPSVRCALITPHAQRSETSLPRTQTHGQPRSQHSAQATLLDRRAVFDLTLPLTKLGKQRHAHACCRQGDPSPPPGYPKLCPLSNGDLNEITQSSWELAHAGLCALHADRVSKHLQSLITRQQRSVCRSSSSSQSLSRCNWRGSFQKPAAALIGVHYRLDKSPPLAPTRSQINPLHSRPSEDFPTLFSVGVSMFCSSHSTQNVLVRDDVHHSAAQHTLLLPHAVVTRRPLLGNRQTFNTHQQ